MFIKRILWSIAAGGLSLTAFSQKIAAIPADPLELVTGQIQVADTPASREAVVQLLDRAKGNYNLRSTGEGYHLKVNFVVNSGGETAFDGAWEFEDLFDPKQGQRWTAKSASGYAAMAINSNQKSYGEGPPGAIPLRLHEARAALLGPMGNVTRSIRTSSATFHGVAVTCVLLSTAANVQDAAPGRRWDETEECIDPQSGLLQTHSQVPGRYYAYDYSNAPQLAGHVLPRKIIVTEAGKAVSEITVDSLAALPSADPGLFVPSATMKESGAAVAMGEAQKISRFSRQGPFKPGATAQPVVVFGLLTAWGELLDAHSLQPQDPNSQAAVEMARQMKFSNPAPPGTRPSQHFVFVIEKFVSSP